MWKKIIAINNEWRKPTGIVSWGTSTISSYRDSSSTLTSRTETNVFYQGILLQFALQKFCDISAAFGAPTT